MATEKNLTIITPKTSCIYFLPKIHKLNSPGRPIVSSCNCLTELISSCLDKIMAPIVKTLPSYTEDSQHALETFRDLKRLRRKTLTAFHSFSHFTLTTTQLNLSFLKTFNYSKTIQRPVLSFRDLY